MSRVELDGFVLAPESGADQRCSDQRGPGLACDARLTSRSDLEALDLARMQCSELRPAHWATRPRELQGHYRFYGRGLVNLAVTWNRRRFPFAAIEIHGMFCTFAMKRAPVSFEVPDQVTTLHYIAITNGSRITS